MAQKSSQLGLLLLSKIPPSRIELYLKQNGWSKVGYLRKDVAVYRHHDLVDEEIVSPEDSAFKDYALRVQEIIEKVARLESADSEDVLMSLLQTGLPDIFETRVVEKATEAGTIPLREGVDLINGVTRALDAAAHSVFAVPGLTMKRVDAMVREHVSECRLGPTSRGSYIIRFICPEAVRSTVQTTLKGQEEQTDTRRITITLMERVNQLVDAAEKGKNKELLALPLEERIVLSDFCHALDIIAPKAIDARVDMEVKWAGAAPKIKSPEVIHLQKNHFSWIRAFKKELDERPEDDVLSFTGRIYELRDEFEGNSIDQIKRVVVYFKFQEGTRQLCAKMVLLPSEREKAGAAYLGKTDISVEGRLLRAPQMSTITDPKNFRPVDEHE